MDDPELEQVTIRGAVQSGKTASLIAAGLGHMAAGRSVLIFEPDDKLKRALAARVIAWGRACKDEVIREAYEPKRPPFTRSTDAGGRLEVISAREGGAAVMRTAEVVIVDELRLFHVDLLGDLVDRMAAYGGRGRLITASSAGYENECKTSTELEKSDARHWFLRCPGCGQENIASWANVNYKARRYPFYTMPCCGSALEGVAFRRAMQAGRWKATKEEMVPGTRGYHLDAFLSPFESLRTIVRQWKRADAHRKQTGSLAETISFQTGRLAIPYKPEAAQGVTPEALRTSCREDYDASIVPAGASMSIGAVDTAGQSPGGGSLRLGPRRSSPRRRIAVEGLGQSRVPGPPARRALVSGFAAGRWNIAASMATPARQRFGSNWRSSWSEPRPHATGPLLRPVVVGIDTGGHYTNMVADFCRTRGGGYQPLKGLPPQRFGAILARRSVTADSLESYGPEGLMLVCGNSGKASCFSLMRQSIAGAEPRPMTWPMDETRYGPEEFEGICFRNLDPDLGQAHRRDPLDVEEDRPRKRTVGPVGVLASRSSPTWAWVSCSPRPTPSPAAAGRKEAA